MPCEPFEDQLLEYVENQLPAAERALVETHLAGCAKCRAFAQQLQYLDAQLTHTLKAPRLSPAFQSKLRQRIQAARIMSPAEIARRKRELQFEYQAGLQRLSLFPQWPRRFLDLLGLAAMLGLAGWLACLIVPPTAIEAGISGLSAANQHLLLLTAVGLVPVVIGLLLAFPVRRGQSWLWQPAGGSFASAPVA
jgi:anti-sigma factor RsiW